MDDVLNQTQPKPLSNQTGVATEASPVMPQNIQTNSTSVPIESVPVSPQPTTNTNSKNILLIEDDPVIIRMYSTKLNNSGYMVKEALNGEDALVALKSFHPYIILLDLMLPKLDGFGFLEQAKSVIGNTPVLILTNLSQETDKTRAKSLGAVDFLIKADITPQDVVSAIQKHL